jgi:hypothetical protein
MTRKRLELNWQWLMFYYLFAGALAIDAHLKGEFRLWRHGPLFLLPQLLWVIDRIKGHPHSFWERSRLPLVLSILCGQAVVRAAWGESSWRLVGAAVPAWAVWYALDQLQFPPNSFWRIAEIPLAVGFGAYLFCFGAAGLHLSATFLISISGCATLFVIGVSWLVHRWYNPESKPQASYPKSGLTSE